MSKALFSSNPSLVDPEIEEMDRLDSEVSDMLSSLREQKAKAQTVEEKRNLRDKLRGLVANQRPRNPLIN